jgi:hypothetical protein
MNVRYMLGVLLLTPLLPWVGPSGFADGPPVAKPATPPLTPPDQKPALKSYEVPCRMTATKHVMVRAKLNGKGPYNFIVDSGAPAVFLTTAVCKEVGVTPDDKHWGTFDKFEIEGGPVLTGTKARVEDMFQLSGMNGLGLAGVKLHGVLGYALLAKYRLEFDFSRDTMTWTELGYEPRPFQAVGGGKNEGLETVGQLAKGLGELLGKGIPDVKCRGFLGIELRDGDDGVEVRGVLADSPGAKAGIKTEDRITHVQGKRVRSAAEVLRQMGELPAGETAKLTILRGAASRDLSVKLGEGL